MKVFNRLISSIISFLPVSFLKIAKVFQFVVIIQTLCMCDVFATPPTPTITRCYIEFNQPHAKPHTLAGNLSSGKHMTRQPILEERPGGILAKVHQLGGIPLIAMNL